MNKARFEITKGSEEGSIKISIWDTLLHPDKNTGLEISFKDNGEYSTLKNVINIIKEYEEEMIRR